MPAFDSPMCTGTTHSLPPELLGSASSLLHPPLKGLFFRGNLALLARRRLAIVGSRRASAQGLQDARAFAQATAQAGLVVVSGLAVGIDAASHEGALAAPDGLTIAVMAHGLDEVYPARHTALAERILKAGGLILSEYPDTTPARPFQFIHRNRIIAALSEAVCVIEAGARSGSLITALTALELGKEVCAVPGSIHSPLYAGSHQLIQQGAGLVTCPEELLMNLGVLALSPSSKPPGAAYQNQDPRIQELLSVLDWNGQSTDQLADRLGQTPENILVTLLLSENQQLAARLPNGDWVRFSGTHRSGLF